MSRHDHILHRVNLLWPVRHDVAPPGPGEVHVWCARQDCPATDAGDVPRVLSADEQSRAARFRSGELRRRFVGSRMVLRTILGRCLGIAPDRVVFETDARGKPRLRHGSGLCFNLSHSADLMLLAVSGGVDLGVDLERIRPMNDALGIAQRFFTPREAVWLAEQERDDLDRTFFQLWTRKEAVLKATGRGISHGLDAMEMLTGEGVWRETVRVDGEPAASWWRLHELDPARGFVGALAVPEEANVQGIRFSTWPDF